MALNPRIRQWQGRRVWLVGASSGIGLALAEHLASLGAKVAVSARQTEPLEQFAARHPGALALPLDVTDAAALKGATLRLWQHWGGLDHTVYCAGMYRPLRASEFDREVLQQHMAVNYGGAVNWLAGVLPRLLHQGHGHVSLVASVAGYGGLPQALAYGPTKAAMIHLAEGLYLDLHDQGVAVSLIDPGFVKTPLTAQNTFAMPALQTSEQAARAIVRGWATGRFEIHFPRRFTWGLKVLQWLPYRAYFALVRRSTGL